MATLTKDRAKAPLIDGGNVSIRKNYGPTDFENKTFSFDLLISHPWAPQSKNRDYTVRMTATDALRIARAIITEIHDGMDLVMKELKR